MLCWGGGRYLPPWFGDLDASSRRRGFPARRIHGPAEAFRAGHPLRDGDRHLRRGSDSPRRLRRGARRPARASCSGPRSGPSPDRWPTISPFRPRAGSTVTPTRWSPTGSTPAASRPASGAGRPTSSSLRRAWSRSVFRRAVSASEVAAFRAAHAIPEGPIVLYAGRLVAEKGLEVLASAWPQVARRPRSSSSVTGRCAAGWSPCPASPCSERWCATEPARRLRRGQ